MHRKIKFKIMEDINTPSIESENVDPNNGRIYRKMFRRILDIASKASDGISTNEYDLLNDTINGLTTAMIAKKQGSTNDMVYKKTNKAIDKLEKIIDRWENSALQEADFHKLQEECDNMYQYILDKDKRIKNLEEEVAKLNEELLFNTYNSHLDEKSVASVILLNKKLMREVTNLRLPVRVAKCLIENNVKTIFDLVSLSESEIRQIDGLTTEDADTVIDRITKIKFKPGMKFRWDELHKLYYLEDK